MMEFITIHFDYNGNYVLGIGKDGNAQFGWLRLIARINNNNKMNWKRKQYVGKTYRNRDIVGHWYPLVSKEWGSH